MTRTLIVLTSYIFLSACAKQQGNSSSIKTSISDKVSLERTTDYSKAYIDTTEGIDRSEWTSLDYLNFDPEYPFVLEDSIFRIGIVTISETVDTYDKQLTVFDNSGKVIATIEQKESDVVTVYKDRVYDRNDSLNPFSPRLYNPNPDYFRLAFDCISSDKEFYTVIINRQTGEKGKIKKRDKFFKFQTIEKFVETWAVLGFDFDRSSNPLRKGPSNKSEEIYNVKQEKYKIWDAGLVSRKGDWIEVAIEETSETGWIRWRLGNKILIRMYYAC